MSMSAAAGWRMPGAEGLSRGSEAAAAGAPAPDEAAFERLHARTARPLWAYLHRVTGDPAVADDVHQESYLRYLAHPCPAAGERQGKAYLFRIASNLLRDRWRRERRERLGLERLLAERSATAAPGRVDLKVDVESVLGRLKPRQRALLWLAYVEGYRHEEIARILDLKAASIRVLLFRARRRLAALLAEHGLEPELPPAAAADPSTPDREVRR